MRHRATSRFWSCYHDLPAEVQRAADRAYALLKADPRHPSLHFKRIGRFYSVRIGLGYRALAVHDDAGALWVWIGSHAQYDQLVRDAL
ncbi:MAG: hypothetical protein LCH53_02295 [Bacteroidetes bacterium]|nr:hypothetical protein [Bacteroidota bacterium]